MQIYLQAQGTRVWRSLITGWTPPTLNDQIGATIVKLEIGWSDAEITLSDYNNKALNSIVGSLHESIFILVTCVNEANKAWEILETRFERTNDAKQSKLCMVLSEFEALKMNEDEIITDFHS